MKKVMTRKELERHNKIADIFYVIIGFVKMVSILVGIGCLFYMTLCIESDTATIGDLVPQIIVSVVSVITAAITSDILDELDFGDPLIVEIKEDK